MKKSSLLKMKNLPATEEMLAVAREDVPVKVGSGWNTSYRCRYSGFARSSVGGGILKVTLYDPDAMRLGGTLPVYEISWRKKSSSFSPMTVPMTMADGKDRLSGMAGEGVQ